MVPLRKMFSWGKMKNSGELRDNGERKGRSGYISRFNHVYRTCSDVRKAEFICRDFSLSMETFGVGGEQDTKILIKRKLSPVEDTFLE